VAKGRKTSEEASHTAKKRAKEGEEKAGRCHPRANFLDRKTQPNVTTCIGCAKNREWRLHSASMNTNAFSAVLLSLAIIASPVFAGDQPSQPPVPKSPPPPGVELAQTISMVTGVAISPLLGVSAVGAWNYFKTPAARRAALPWFAQPWFFVPALILVMAVFAKDSLGPVIPTALKKPFDLAELIENKLSALVAAGAFLPFIVSVFPNAAVTDSTAGGPLVWAAVEPAQLGNLLLTPFAVAAFAIVWLASHAINILILISPFGTVDAALKGFRLFILSTVAVTSFANPYVGAAWALVIILICYLLAGWSFRMLVFGTVFSWDLLTAGRRRFVPGVSALCAFTSRKMQKVPVRTYGHLSRDEHGQLVFTYRPWLVFGAKTVVLPTSNLAVGRGFLNPSLMAVHHDSARALFSFPPRCRTHEESLAQLCGCSEVRDVGLRGLWRWLRELFGFRGNSQTETGMLASV